MLELKELRKKSLEELKEMLAKENKTIKDYIEIELKKSDAYDYSSDSYDECKMLDFYYYETQDNTILTEDEFSALANYSGEYAKTSEDIKKFIDSMKFYDIKDTQYLTSVFSTYYPYSIVNLDSEEQLYLKEMIRKYKEEDNLEYRECATKFIEEKAKEFLPKRNNR